LPTWRQPPEHFNACITYTPTLEGSSFLAFTLTKRLLKSYQTSALAFFPTFVSQVVKFLQRPSWHSEGVRSINIPSVCMQDFVASFQRSFPKISAWTQVSVLSHVCMYLRRDFVENIVLIYHYYFTVHFIVCTKNSRHFFCSHKIMFDILVLTRIGSALYIPLVESAHLFCINEHGVYT
jgi:hypothetical protein